MINHIYLENDKCYGLEDLSFTLTKYNIDESKVTGFLIDKIEDRDIWFLKITFIQ